MVNVGDPCLESASFRLRIKFGHACSTSEVEQLMNTAGKGARDRRGRSRGRFSKRKREAEDKTSEVVEQATWLYPDRLREVIPIPPLAPIGCVQVGYWLMKQGLPIILFIAGKTWSAPPIVIGINKSCIAIDICMLYC